MMSPEEQRQIDEGTLWARQVIGQECNAGTVVRGGNNIAVKIETDLPALCLKLYFPKSDDDRRRALNEYKALTFLNNQHISQLVPEVFKHEEKPPRLLMSWIEGEPANLAMEEADIEFCARFIFNVAETSESSDAQRFGYASEACLSDQEIIQQLKKRRQKLLNIPELGRFLEQLDLVLEQSIKKARHLPWFETSLTNKYQKLIAADFNLNNVIRTPESELKVVDFEYFGWDDPTKATGDFLLHPAMSLTKSQMQQFVNYSLHYMKDLDEGYEERLEKRFGFYALRWSLIVLKPFLFDNASDDLKQERLSKAFNYLKIAQRGWNNGDCSNILQNGSISSSIT